MAEETSGPGEDKSCNRLILDPYNSDLYLKIDPDGYACETLNHPSGFQYLWAGARATCGINTGKVCFEVLITRHLPVDVGTDHDIKHPHLVRVGWSVDSHSLQLGKDPLSYGYGGTGNISFDGNFNNYGQPFTEGDVIMALVDFNMNPASISYCKNGIWLGKAASVRGLGHQQALFPHVLLKNCRIKINYGQETSPWFAPPPGYVFIDDVPVRELVRGLETHQERADCEMIMIVGLPGSGKTKWALKKQDENFAKRYNILGTDKLIDMMKVVGLPRKDFQRRWEALSQEANVCLNTLLDLASKKNRNYILDQTNVYSSARKRKMSNFQGFKRICAVMQPQDLEMKRRMAARTRELGKAVPEKTVLEMKANYTLPQDSDPYLDGIIWVELGPSDCQELVEQYRKEGLRKECVGYPEPQSNSPTQVGIRENRSKVKDQSDTCYHKYLLGLKTESNNGNHSTIHQEQSTDLKLSHDISGISGATRGIGRQGVDAFWANDGFSRALSGWGDSSMGDYNQRNANYCESLMNMADPLKGGYKSDSNGQFLNPGRGGK